MTSLDTLAALSWTPLTLEDAPAVTALLNRIDAAEQRQEPAEEPTIRDWLSMPGHDLGADSFAVRDGERLVAFGLLDVASGLDRDGRARCELSGGVDPEYRRRGLGTALLERGEERAAQVAADRHSGADAIVRVSGGRDPEPSAGDGDGDGGGDGAGAAVAGGADVRPVLDRRGYHRARSWFSMGRGLPAADIESRQLPGLELLAPAEDHLELTRLAHVAAFADHWGSAPVTPERWRALCTSHAARPALSTIAVDAEGTVLGYALATEDRAGVLHIALVGTRPEARGRGIARAVIARSLDAASRAGCTTAELEVDTESLTGATRLYEALGFTRRHVDSTYEKPLR
ncbi:GNAT family N-acetyltransferase [Brachybacterium sp. GCM10030267]|uniref:GNAT family N-acetyltransferase n=1 Tax=Brachybacterium sp. GCM10030267 TaxID=3273381 RepID=UPI00360AC330